MVLLELKREILNGILMIGAIISIAWMAVGIYRFYQKRHVEKYPEFCDSRDEGHISMITKETTLTNDFTQNMI